MLHPQAGQKPTPVLVTPSCRLLRARLVRGGVVPGTATQVSRFLPNKNTELDTLPSPFLCQLPLLSAEFCCVPTCLGLIRNLRDGFSHVPISQSRKLRPRKVTQSQSCLSDAHAVT